MSRTGAAAPSLTGICAAIVIGAFAVHPPALAEAPAGAEELARQAVERNPAVRAARARYEAARSRISSAWLPEDPMVGIDVEGQEDLFDRSSRSNYEYMVSQTIPFPTKLLLRGVVAAREADAAYQAYKQQELEAVWRVEKPVYRLALARRTADALRETQALVEQLAGVVKSRYESNKARQSDYLKIQIEQEQIEIERFDWEQRVLIASAEISRQLDRPLGETYEPASPGPRRPLAWSLAELEAKTLAGRPELKSLEALIARARAERAHAQTEWLPDLTGRIEMMQERGDDAVSRYDNFIGVSVPVWSLLKGVSGGWEAARRDVEEAEAAYADMRSEALLRVHDAHARHRSAEYALATYESLILPQTRSQVDIALSAYEAGTADILDLLDAERTYKNTQIAYYRALTDWEEALSDLRLAVGDPLDDGGKLS